MDFYRDYNRVKCDACSEVIFFLSFSMYNAINLSSKPINLCDGCYYKHIVKRVNNPFYRKDILLAKKINGVAFCYYCGSIFSEKNKTCTNPDCALFKTFTDY